MTTEFTEIQENGENEDMGKTKRRYGKRIIALCMLLSLLFLLLFPQPASAAEEDKAVLTVGQVFTNYISSAVDDTFTYELTAQNPADPMPTGSSEGVYAFALTGASASQNITIQYPAAGTYNYTIRQVVAVSKPGYTYDTQVYTMQVTALSGSDGVVAFAVIKNSSGVKVPAIEFANGYAVLPGPIAFTKQVKDPATGNFGESIIVTDPNQNVEYSVRVTLGQLAECQSLELVDPLDSRLNYQSARVLVNGQDITAVGTLQFEQATNTLRYAFASPVDRTLEGQTVELRLVVTVKPDLTDHADIYNRASLVINGDKPIETIDTPKLVLDYGHIYGYIFEDTNRNGLRDDALPGYINNMQVRLEAESGGEWKLVQITIADAGGRFAFRDISGRSLPLAFGNYRVGIENLDGSFTYTEQIWSEHAFTGNCSDADALTGFAGFELCRNLRRPVVGIGLIPPSGGGGSVPVSPEPTIRKFPSARQVRPGSSVDYTISGFGNNTGNSVRNFGVTDVVPNGLIFTGGSFPAFANGKGVVYSIEYITNFNSSYRVLHSNIPADAPFSFGAPSLQAGEKVTMVTMTASSVPAGFGAGNSMTFNFRVTQNAPAVIINSALYGRGQNMVSVDSSEVEVDVSEKDSLVQIPVEEDGAPQPIIETIPLRGIWSLLNLLIVLFSLLALVILGIRIIRKRREDDEDEDEDDTDEVVAEEDDEEETEPETIRKKNPILLMVGIVLWAAAAIVMFLTQDWLGRMVWMNRWTPLIAILAGLSVLAAALSSRKVDADEEDEEEQEEQ